MEKPPLTSISDIAPEKVPNVPSQPARRGQIRRWDSRDLFGGTRELLIQHAGSEYHLRLTSQGKLVLTK
jgi:hemin uptake protein HemP